MSREENMVGKIYNGKYEVKSLLGAGSTSKVYLVKDIVAGKYYAMKVSEHCTLIKQESELLKALQNHDFPEWTAFFESETVQGVEGFLVMEYIEGESLQSFLNRQGKVSLKSAVNIMLQILDSLSVLHLQSPPMIYKDLKPENIIIGRNGRVRLIDLGGAVDNGFRIGTYGYAAPEQFWSGVRLGPECDIYAAGKVLAYLMTGKNPWEPPYDMLEYCRRDRNIPTEIYHVLQRSLAVESVGRYAVVEQFIRELKDADNASRRKWWSFRARKQQIVYEKCIWKSEYQRIF